MLGFGALGEVPLGIGEGSDEPVETDYSNVSAAGAMDNEPVAVTASF